MLRTVQLCSLALGPRTNRAQMGADQRCAEVSLGTVGPEVPAGHFPREGERKETFGG